MPAEAIVDFYDEVQVAEQLLLNDDQVTSYEYVLGEDELQALALESARTLIAARRSLLLGRQEESRPATGEQATKTVVVTMVTRDGRTFGQPSEPYAPRRRFG